MLASFVLKPAAVKNSGYQRKPSSSSLVRLSYLCGFRRLLAALNEGVNIFTTDSDSAWADARKSKTAFEAPPLHGADRDAEEFRNRFIIQVFVSHGRLRMSLVLHGWIDLLTIKKGRLPPDMAVPAQNPCEF
jgi:hypothetical protein